MDQENNDESPSAIQIYDLHQARLLDVIKYLKDGKGVIIIQENESGKPLRYGYDDRTSLTLKDFMKSALPEASDNAIDKYFRSDYELIERTTDYRRLNKAHKRQLVKIEVSFLHRRAGDKAQQKEKYYLTDISSNQPIPIKQLYPNFTKRIVDKIAKIKKTGDKGSHHIPELILNEASFSGFRDKELEQPIFDYLLELKYEGDGGKVDEISRQLARLIEEYENKHQQNVKNKRYQATKQLLPDQQNFSQLMNGEMEHNQQIADEVIELSEFVECFQNEEYWFDGHRFDKLSHHRGQLLTTPVSGWPEVFIAHVLFALHEYICIQRVIRQIVREEANRVVYKLYYSKEGKEVSVIETEYSENKVIERLIDYEIELSKFTDRIQDNGNILKSPLKRLPEDAKDEHNLDTSVYADRFNEMVKQFIADKLLQQTRFGGRSWTAIKNL